MRMKRTVVRKWTAALLMTAAMGVCQATSLSTVTLQDLNGFGGNDVQQQTTDSVSVKAYASSDNLNRKALFLFDLTSFNGRDLTDQYIHTASFTVYAENGLCDAWNFRLYGLTDTANNDDSLWDETLTAQSQANWPDRYWGAYQYPNTDYGAKHLDTQNGPPKDNAVSFGSTLLNFVRWGVGRNPSFGYSSTNPDGKITLLLAREEYDTNISDFHSRQCANTSYRPRLDLDVRFPEIGLALAGTPKSSGSTYDFGSFQGLGGPVVRSLVIDNTAGEALSSLHVKTLTLLGTDAWAFQLVTPGGTDFLLPQGTSTSGYEVRFNPDADYGVFDDARIVLTCNDENESTYTVYLSATHTPAPAVVTLLDPVPPATNVPYRVSELTFSGGSSNVVGHLWWTNSSGGGGTLPPGPGGAWETNIALAVGANLVTVSGSNIWGAVDSCSVTITRSDNLPSLAITNPPGWFAAVSHSTETFPLSGTVNENVVGALRWSGPGGAGGEWPAVNPWMTNVLLAIGVNAFTVIATNDTGQAVTGQVTVARQPAAWLQPGDIVIPGWQKLGAIGNGSQFVLATLAHVPEGTVLYFTDNGAFTTGQFLGAMPSDADGLESLCAMVCAEDLPAGTLVRSGDASNGCIWVASGRICVSAPQVYSWPMIDTRGDQLYVFQSAAANPLLQPNAFITVLDDTGTFEPPSSIFTGDIPPGLVASDTAWTFPFGMNSGAYFDFSRFVNWISTPSQWLTRFATSKHWLVNPPGALPTGRFLVGELLLLAIDVTPPLVKLTFTCAYPKVPCTIHSCTNLVVNDWEQVWEGLAGEGPQSKTISSETPAAAYRVRAQSDN
jgi:hypothetical protein